MATKTMNIEELNDSIASCMNMFLAGRVPARMTAVSELDNIGVTGMTGVSFDNDEKTVVAHLFNVGRSTSNYSQLLNMLSRKIDISESTFTFEEACKQAKLPAKKEGSLTNAKSMIGKLKASDFMGVGSGTYGGLVGKAIKSGDMTAEDLLSVMCAANHHKELLEKALPAFDRLEFLQKTIAKGAIKLDKVDIRENVDSALTKIGVATNILKETLNFSYQKESLGVDKLAEFYDLSKTKFDYLTNMSAEAVVLAMQQTESAMLSNAVLDAIIKPDNPSSWRINADLSSNDKKLVESLICREGETFEDVTSRVTNYSKEISALLLSINPIPNPEGVNYFSSATTEKEDIERQTAIVRDAFVKACVKEGAFALDTAEERYAAYTRAACAESVTKYFAEKPLNAERSVVSYVDETTGRTVEYSKPSYVFDSDGRPVELKQEWFNGVSLKGKGIDEIKDIIRVHGPGDLKLADIDKSNFALGKGNRLSQAANFHYIQKFGTRENAKKDALMLESRADINGVSTNYSSRPSLFRDLPYYIQAFNQAKNDMVRFGIKIITPEEVDAIRARAAAAESEGTPTESEESSSTPTGATTETDTTSTGGAEGETEESSGTGTTTTTEEETTEESGGATTTTGSTDSTETEEEGTGSGSTTTTDEEAEEEARRAAAEAAATSGEAEEATP